RGEAAGAVRDGRRSRPHTTLEPVGRHRRPREGADVLRVAREGAQGPDGEREGEEGKEDGETEGEPGRTETRGALDPGPQHAERMHRNLQARGWIKKVRREFAGRQRYRTLSSRFRSTHFLKRLSHSS